MPQPRIMLVVTGDDFGYCPKRNQGIVDCFKAGGISSVSLLVNASAAKDAADLAKRHKIPIGLHANLSEGIPVCQSLRQASTLVNEHGFFHGKIGFRQALERHQLSMKQSYFFLYVEVELELRDQIRLFRELTGYLPHHMDGHQHVHILQEVREVFAQVLSDHKIPFTRVPVEPGLHSCQWLPTHLQRFYAQVEKDALESIPVFRHYGIRWPEVYLGLTTVGQNMSVSNLQRALSHALSRSSCGISSSEERVITAELMVHPGYPSHPQKGGCGEGPDDFSQSDDRQHELSVLTDLSLLAMYRQERVQLCAFKDL
ncbi:carbohydrate deacetylase isoform X5 [Phycodurus eques]|uniref:carbohydrate deacetylase isoform X5 n=1 Tax=Phycodurus eques TaxID=693459 RepID=UPI002ACDA1EA|nr:carbohydrate deacetylase isoform X5 [Phycodurus eques]